MNKRARGTRPSYFRDPHVDRLLAVLMALFAEVSVLRERLDTVERVADQLGVLPRAEIAGFAPDKEAQEEREAARLDFINRVLRVYIEEAERSLDEEDRTIEDVVAAVS